MGSYLTSPLKYVKVYWANYYQKITERHERNMVDYQLIEVIKSILYDGSFNPVNIGNWSTLLSSARTHGLLPCVAYYSELLSGNLKPEEKIASYLKSILMKSTYLSTNQILAAQEIQKTFEENQVYNLVVKGIKTKMRYPSDILRSMGDIDILYKTDQHKRVYDLMMNTLGYDDYQEGRKNDTYTRDKYIVVEAHRQLVSTESEFIDYLDGVWDRAVPCKDQAYTCEMTVEDEFIYNIIHLVEHFKHGGVGVRFIMDIWVYNQTEMNRQYLKDELVKLNLYDFYLTISSLAEYWFGEGESTELLEKLGEFIFSSGVFGNHENSSALAVEDGGRLKTLIKICFPSYKEMASMFLWLKKYPFLLPVSWVIRAFRSITRRKANVRIQLQNLKEGDIEKGKQIKEFYKECGLN